MKAIYYKKFENIVESGAKHHKPNLLESYNPKSHKSDIIHNGKTIESYNPESHKSDIIHNGKTIESYNPESHKSDIIHNGKTTTEQYSGEHELR